MKTVTLVLLLSIFVYGIFLDRTPIHLNQDELGFTLNAYSISQTGFDENGRFLPLYFWHLGVMWATPIIVYLTALVLKFVPLSEIAIRLPSVIIGITNIILIYFLAGKIFKDGRYAILAAVLLATTPIHFIQSRILLDNLYIVLFVIGWLLLLVHFLEKRRPLFLLLAGLVLGIGFYSYHAARIMMPFYLLATLVFLLPEIRKNKKLIFIAFIGFIVPLLPLIPWTQQYPETLFIDQARYTGIYDTANKNVLSGIASVLSQESLSHRFDVFFSYFNPVYMFLLGDASLIHSTSLHHPLGLGQSAIRAGVFLLPLAAFIPLGVYSAVRKRNRLNLLILFGFFTAPIAGALAGDHFRYSRILVILPFAILLAVYGVQFMLFQKKRILPVTCYLLLVTTLLHFSYFLYDYFTDYRVRSYSWMKYNIPGVLEEVIKQDSDKPANVIYLDNKVNFISRYWKFYLEKHGKDGLEEKTIFIDPQEALEGLEKNSILVLSHHDVDGQKEQVGEFKKTSTIREPDSVPVFYIYRN